MHKYASQYSIYMQHGKRQKPTREEVLVLFKHIKENRDVLQREIAAGTGLHQGAVSKILNGHFQNVEGRAYQVWKYAKHRADKTGYKSERPDAGKADSRLTEKISKVWDRTEEGANALLKLLDAADLMQKRRRAERDT